MSDDADARSVRWPVERWIPALDATRGIAAFAVVVHHSSQQHFQPSAGPVWMVSQFLGAWGVTLFFVLSGFCIHLPQARRAALGVTTCDWASFAKRRAWRLLPTHYAALVLAALVACEVPSSLITVPTVGTFAAHVFMVHTLSAAAFFSINAVFWSIALEVHFYATYPVLLWAKRHAGRALIPLLLGLALLTYFIGSRYLTGGPRWVGQHLFLVTWWQWALGVALADLYVQGAAPRWAWLVRFPGAVPAWAAATLLIGVCDPTVLGLHVRYWVLPAACTALLAAVLLRAQPTRSAFVAIWAPVGKYSYSLYLVHPVALAVIWRFFSARLPGAATRLVADALAALAVSWAFFLLVERRFLPATQRAEAGREPEVADVTPIAGAGQG